MDKDDQKFLEDNGWIIVCESPLEIQKGERNFVYGSEAARLVILGLKIELGIL